MIDKWRQAIAKMPPEFQQAIPEMLETNPQGSIPVLQFLCDNPHWLSDSRVERMDDGKLIVVMGNNAACVFTQWMAEAGLADPTKAKKAIQWMNDAVDEQRARGKAGGDNNGE